MDRVTLDSSPQGYGHYIEHIGDEPTEVLILFNSGEYQEISLATGCAIIRILW
jgi:oxalate decarboxylase/phosphoglucose isomerase-like protein (cupin superfamily)